MLLKNKISFDSGYCDIINVIQKIPYIINKEVLIYVLKNWLDYFHSNLTDKIVTFEKIFIKSDLLYTEDGKKLAFLNFVKNKNI